MDSLATTQGSSKDQSNAETWLSPKEAAARIGVAVSTLSAWRTTRRTPLRYSRPSRQVIRYALSDVETFMRTCRVPARCGDAKIERASSGGGAIMIKASDVQLACADRKTFREHVIALSCSRDFDVDLELAFEEVLDPSDRRILLAVCTSAQVINEAEYFAQHSALADDDTQAEEARAQIQHAHDNRDRVVDNIINHLRGDSESFAQPHTDDATYAASKASLAVDHAISTVCSVAAIRELCRGLSDAKG